MFEDEYIPETELEVVVEPFIPTYCKIKLANGTVLDNLELNGNNFISQGIMKDSIFEDNLSTVEITQTTGAETTTKIYHNMKLLQNTTRFSGGKQSWFVLAEMTQDEIEKIELEKRVSLTEANTMYLSMMTGVEL